MCLSPISIRNPNKFGFNGTNSYQFGHNKRKDCTSQYITVPCGVCPSCVALKQNYKVQRMLMQSFDSHFFFFTLTYNNDTLPCININGFNLSYADTTDIRYMFKRIRKDNLLGVPFSYCYVTEYGSKRHRPHFHGFITVSKRHFSDDSLNTLNTFNFKLSSVLKKQWKRCITKGRHPVYKNLTTYVNDHRGRNFDCHYCRPFATDEGLADALFYVTKYVLKTDPYVRRLQQALKLNVPDDQYREVWNLLKPKFHWSHNFGVNEHAKRYIINGINASVESGSLYPKFFYNSSGKAYPLSPYYRNLYLTFEQDEIFMNRLKEHYKYDLDVVTVDNVILQEIYDPAEISDKYSKWRKTSSHLAGVHLNSTFDPDTLDNFDNHEFITESYKFFEETRLQDNSVFDNTDFSDLPF